MATSYYIGDALHTDVPRDASGRQLTTRIVLDVHGVFIAPNDAIAYKLAHSTKRQMVKAICDTWPELIKDATWTRAYLQAQPSYVLAVILTQI